LNVPHTLVPLLPTPLPPQKWQTARAEDLVWAKEFLVPWVLRRLRHQSSGDGIVPKRPTPGPVFGPGVLPGDDGKALRAAALPGAAARTPAD